MFSNHLVRYLFSSLIFLISFLAKSQDEAFVMSQIGPNNLLDTPLDLNYGPDGYLWVTEKTNGTVVRVNLPSGTRDELISIPDAFSSGGQDGLLGLTFHTDFLSENPYVYLSYTVGTNLNNIKQKLVRYTFSLDGTDGVLSSPVVLIDNLPASNDHNSGKLVFGADGKLYYTIGDQGNKDCNSNLAQYLPTQEEIDSKNWVNYPGKILRFNTDGSIPEDNPILNGVRSHIYSYGHRNPQGLILANNGVLYSSEHGPSSDDEINIINSGKNYGWPYVAGYKDDSHDAAICDASKETLFDASNYQDPIMSLFVSSTYRDPLCTDSWMCRANIAPSGMAIYENEAIASWNKSLLVTSLKRGRIYKLQLNEDGSAVDKEEITQHFYTQNRYRDIVVSPDGTSIFIITDSSGKTSDASSMNVVTTLEHPGAILKFTYEDALSVNSDTLYERLKVWPNPAKHVLFISLSGPYKKEFKIELINTVGQVVKEFLNVGLGTSELNIEDVSRGVYALKLSSKNKSLLKRVVLY